MRKCLLAICISFTFTDLIIAQQVDLVIKGYGKDLHLDHTVSPKEGIYSIGRLYNVHPKTIAAYNKLDMAKGLTIGQVIHIPLNDTNFTQKSNKGRPVYYSVGAKETLEKVSNIHNKVSLQNLREWNKLNNDNLPAGKKLVVGFLVSNENGAATTTVERKEVTAKDTIAKQPIVKSNTGQDKPAVKEERKKGESKKAEIVSTKPPAMIKDTVAKQVIVRTNKEPDQNLVKEEQKKDESKKIETADTRSTTAGNLTGQGYFKSSFDQQIKTRPVAKSETVTAGIFRMTNGSQETKYYMLIDGITAGTIVRVINPDNNKAIYAKVLGEMGGIRQNQGLNIRISNAAASTLDITDTDKFIVKINY